MKKEVSVNLQEIILPTTSQLEQELKREKYKFRYKKSLRSTIYVLLVVVAISVIVATFMFPVLQIYGESMTPTLYEDDIVVSVKKSNFTSGDVVAFYYNNRILVKRVIAKSSDWVNIDEDGNVYVNSKLLNESYLKKKSIGDGDIKYPYQVPEGTYFVLGDDREKSIDSRNSEIGTITSDDIVGKVLFKVWPIKKIGIVN